MTSNVRLFCCVSVLAVASCWPAMADVAGQLVEETTKHREASNVTLECDVTIKRDFVLAEKENYKSKIIHETDESQKILIFVREYGQYIDVGIDIPIKNCSNGIFLHCYSNEDYPGAEVSNTLLLDKINGKVFFQKMLKYKSDKTTKTVDGATYRLFSSSTDHIGYCRKRDFKTLF